MKLEINQPTLPNASKKLFGVSGFREAVSTKPY
jgi:hypothetical protein